MSSYGHILVPKPEILVPKIANLGCFGPKPYLKMPNARNFLDQNDCWVEIIKGEKGVKNLSAQNRQFCCSGPKPYLKTPNAQHFLDQNGRWVEIIKGKKPVENLRCGAAVVTKIVKNTLTKK